MLVIDLKNVRLTRLIEQQHCIGARGDSRMDQRRRRYLGDEEGSVGCGVVDPEPTSLIDGGKPFAEILGHYLHDSLRLGSKVPDRGQGVFIILISHGKPLGYSAPRVTE